MLMESAPFHSVTQAACRRGRWRATTRCWTRRTTRTGRGPTTSRTATTSATRGATAARCGGYNNGATGPAYGGAATRAGTGSGGPRSACALPTFWRWSKSPTKSTTSRGWSSSGPMSRRATTTSTARASRRAGKSGPFTSRATRTIGATESHRRATARRSEHKKSCCRGTSARTLGAVRPMSANKRTKGTTRTGATVALYTTGRGHSQSNAWSTTASRRTPSARARCRASQTYYATRGTAHHDSKARTPPILAAAASAGSARRPSVTRRWSRRASPFNCAGLARTEAT